MVGAAARDRLVESDRDCPLLRDQRRRPAAAREPAAAEAGVGYLFAAALITTTVHDSGTAQQATTQGRCHANATKC